MIQKNSLIAATWEQNRTKMILIILLLLAIAGIYAAQRTIVEPNLQRLSTEQIQLQQHVRQRLAEFANSGVPVSIAEQLEENLQQFNDLIPSQSNFSTFLGELFDWSQRAGLSIHQVNYQPEQDEDTGLLRYGLNFSVKGRYAQVKKFIQYLENAERILVIDKISLAGISAKKDKAEVSLRINLTTYFQGKAA